jgi:hypothetical protein
MKFRRAANSFTRLASLARPLRLLIFGLLGVLSAALAITIPLRGRQAGAGPGLTAHEWGTFTAIAGADGQPVEWLPVDLVGKQELPTFVEHFRGAPKDVLRGSVRLETPVIYFYTSQETRVSVHVSFSKGFITEWYPHATRLLPAGTLSTTALYESHEDGSVAWDSITVAPIVASNFAREKAASRYYAARQTSATPLSVPSPTGEQHEKLLFYRGVSTVALPLSAKVLPSGSILFDNLAGQPIPSLIVFERRGDKLGYHIVTPVQNHAIFETPSVSGTIDSLRGDLEDILAAQGLFRDEAQAMLETWGNSWFEEGSRLIYIVPRQYLDSILPLSINPAPTQLARVFVGRIELVTPATETSVEAAITSHDGATLRKYGRFLYPIFNVILAKQHHPATEDHLWEELGVSLATVSSASSINP